jgi:hypothetical protein
MAHQMSTGHAAATAATAPPAISAISQFFMGPGGEVVEAPMGKGQGAQDVRLSAAGRRDGDCANSAREGGLRLRQGRMSSRVLLGGARRSTLGGQP